MEHRSRIFGIMGKRASKLNKDEIKELEESTYCEYQRDSVATNVFVGALVLYDALAM